jgi:hypothetical protein
MGGVGYVRGITSMKAFSYGCYMPPNEIPARRCMWAGREPPTGTFTAVFVRLAVIGGTNLCRRLGLLALMGGVEKVRDNTQMKSHFGAR